MNLTKSVCLCFLVFASVSTTAHADHHIKPNFIIINIDDLGYADIEPFGSELNRTPNLNRMAKEGRKLTSFYAAPVCSPSRAAMMTGSYPKRALPIPHVLFPSYATGLDPSEITVAELLKQQGYTTGIIGKWHLGDQPEFLPRKQGFDYYFGLPYSNDMGPIADGIKSNLGVPLPKPRPNRKGQPPLPLMRNETVLKRVLPDDQQSIVQRYTEEAVSFMWRHQDEPFFLYLPHTAVHFPLYPGKQFHGKSKHGLFGDWVEELDWSVGQILETVRQLGLSEKTLVLFTSDNGGAMRHGARNTPLRGGKASTFEGGMRVPTIAWWPGKIPAGTATDEITSNMDILPTFTTLAGGKVPADRKLDGHDIWPLLSGEENATTPYEVFYYFRGLNLQAVRSGPWKLLLAKKELYNLDDDIGESKNIAKENQEVVAILLAHVEDMENDLGVKGIGPGVRKLGKVENPQPLISFEGKPRAGFEAPKVLAGQGIMMGELTSSSVLAQVRLTKTDHLTPTKLLKAAGDVQGTAGIVEFILHAEGRRSLALLAKATADNDFIARVEFAGLQPGAKYSIKTRIGADAESLHEGPTATFQTLAGETLARPMSFVVVTGMNYAKFHGDNRIDRKIHKKHNNTDLPAPYAKPDKHLGYPSLRSILRLKPNFFVGTGDNVYYDTPKEPRAQTVPEMRQKWHEQFVQPRYRNMFAAVPTYWMVDDHDYRIDDGDNTGDHLPSPETGKRVMLEQLPLARMSWDKAKTYRTHRVSKDLQIWLPENRMHRSPNAMKDGPEKSIWGKEQKAWLMKTLSESNATFKLLVSPTPMIGPDDKRKFDNHTNVNGFRHERDEFFAWLNKTGIVKNFYLVCGDRHWQYHSIHPTGLEEFSSGALVDANSRPGRSPGDPLSTDPDGLIKQVYAQKKPSGGFLLIDSQPAKGDATATLTFRFHDENGVVLHEHKKTAK